MKKAKHVTPAIGSTFEHRYKGTLYTMTVVESDSGVGYEVDGEVYRSPTAAAKAVVGVDQFVNGRKFWKLDKLQNG